MSEEVTRADLPLETRLKVIELDLSAVSKMILHFDHLGLFDEFRNQWEAAASEAYKEAGFEVVDGKLRRIEETDDDQG